MSEQREKSLVFWVQYLTRRGMGLVRVLNRHGGTCGLRRNFGYAKPNRGNDTMGHTLAVMFEAVAQLLHQSIDPVPERVFHLMSGLVLIAIGMRLRRSFE